MALSADEFRRAELRCLQAVQAETFSQLWETLRHNGELKANHLLYALQPIWEGELGLIRVTGRLQYALHDKQPPILLPKNHPFVTLLIRYTHSSLFHAGVSSTLSALREKFWILSGRQQVKLALRCCFNCSKFQSRAYDAPAPPLPSMRITKS